MLRRFPHSYGHSHCCSWDYLLGLWHNNLLVLATQTHGTRSVRANSHRGPLQSLVRLAVAGLGTEVVVMGVCDTVSKDMFRFVGNSSIGRINRVPGLIRTTSVRPVVLGARQVRALWLERDRQSRENIPGCVSDNHLFGSLVCDHRHAPAVTPIDIYHNNGSNLPVVLRRLYQTVSFPDLLGEIQGNAKEGRKGNTSQWDAGCWERTKA